jgi:hypothetical protein
MGQGVADSGTFEGQIDAMNGKGIRVVNRLGQTEEFVVTDGTTIVDQQGNPAELHEGQSVNVEWEQVGTRHVATKITVLRLSGAPAESQPMRTAKGITVLCTLAPLGRGRGEETEDAPVIPFAVLGEVSERRPSLPDDSAAADRVFATAGLDEGPFGQDHRDAQVNFTPAPYGKVLGGLIAWIDDS